MGLGEGLSRLGCGHKNLKSFDSYKAASVEHQRKMSLILRTVPTKYKGYCARSGPREKSRSLPGLSESTKKNMSSYDFFRDN